MPLLDTLKAAFTGKPKAQHNYIGAPSFAKQNPYSLLEGCNTDNFASNYPAIRAIKDEFKVIRPYTIDGNGKPVDSPVINALYHPNRADSSVAFFEKLAVSYLVNRKTYLLVWRNDGGIAKPGGEITPKNIAGFTFLENPSITRNMGRSVFQISTDAGAVEYDETEVITLTSGVDPRNLYDGYTATEASRKWTTLDDYMADYQAGFFENGAVPAGLITVVAPTAKDFNDTVDRLEDSHRGAGKNNNISYAHQPIDQNTGQAAQAQITWTPYSSSNKDIDFKNVFDQVNRRLDLAFGVSQIIKGVDDAATYANAQVSEAGFSKRIIMPLATSIYTGLTHELNRITNGLGVAITFAYEIPAVADDEKVKAETKKIHAAMITSLVTQGYSLDSIVDAFELSNGYKKLTIGNTPAVIENDKPDVDEGGEVNSAPNIDNDGDVKTPKNVKMQISKRDYPELYEGIDIDEDKLGCIMLDTEKLNILDIVGNNSSDDLIEEVDRHDYTMGAVAEIEPHVTMLYGLLENGNTWKDKVDGLLEGWSIDTLKIKDVAYFDSPESYAVIAHIEETTDLLEGRNRLTLLPHVNTFSDYRPHMTLAYIKKDADLAKWLTSLNAEYAGKEIKVSGINYGDLPETNDTKNVKAQEVATRTNPKAKLTDEQKLENATRQYMKKQVDRAVAELGGEAQSAVEPEATEAELEAYIAAMLVVITAIMIANGEIQYAAGAALLPAEAKKDLAEFVLGNTAKEKYLEYLDKVGKSYGDDTAQAIRKVLARADSDGLNLSETKKALRDIMNTDEWRVKRMARTELNRSQSIGSVEAMKQMQGDTGIAFEKSLFHNLGPECQWCKASEGVWVAVSSPLLPVGGAIVGVDGGVLVNDFADNEGSDYHPNGRGVPIYRRVGSTDNKALATPKGSYSDGKFDIHCSDCKRYLGATDKSAEVELKCSASQCKKLNSYSITMLSEHVML